MRSNMSSAPSDFACIAATSTVLALLFGLLKATMNFTELLLYLLQMNCNGGLFRINKVTEASTKATGSVRTQARSISQSVFGFSFSRPCMGIVPPATAELSVCVVLIGAPMWDAIRIIIAVEMDAPNPCE